MAPSRMRMRSRAAALKRGKYFGAVGLGCHRPEEFID